MVHLGRCLQSVTSISGATKSPHNLVCCAPTDCIAAIYNVLGKRRGHVTEDVLRPGTPIYLVKALLPVIESFGFETDLRYHTQVRCFSVVIILLGTRHAHEPHLTGCSFNCVVVWAG